MIFRLGLLVALALATSSAEPFLGSRSAADGILDFIGDNEEDVEDGENRILFTSTSTVTVNSTLLRAIGAIIGSLLLALPLYLAYASHTNSKSTGYGEYGGYSKRRRMAREVDDWASHMHILLESFRKHKVEEDGCQILVACQSGREKSVRSQQPQRNDTHDRHLPGLPAMVNSLLRTTVLLDRPMEGSSAGFSFVKRLLQAHSNGRDNPDSCLSRYADLCSTLKPS